MKLNFRPINQKGSALLQAMMGLGMVGLVTYSALTYQGLGTSENKSQIAQTDIDSAAQIISSLTSIQALCNSNLQLRNNFTFPANPEKDVAADHEVGINIGLATSNRPPWLNPLMAPPNQSIPGLINDFQVRVDRIAITGARYKRHTSATNTLWAGDLVISAQKPQVGMPAVTGRRVVGQIEIELDAAGAKVNCSTSASVASVCRDLGGVYDPLGVPNCVFAMQPMNCDHIPDGYVHNIVGGLPVCRSAQTICPVGFYANGIFEGALNCTRLSRRITYTTSLTCSGGATTTVSAVPASPAGCYCAAGQTWNGTSCVSSCLPDGDLAGVYYGTCTPPNGTAATFAASCCSGSVSRTCDANSDTFYTCQPTTTCTGGATTTVSAVPASPAGCYCAAGQTWDGTSCTASSVACYTRDQGRVVVAGPPVECDTLARFYSTLSACQSAIYPASACSAYDEPPSSCGTVLVGSPAAANCPAAPPPPAPSVPLIHTADMLQPFNYFSDPRCSGSIIEVMRDGFIVNPDFSVTNFTPPLPAGASCVSYECTNANIPCIDFEYHFFSGALQNSSSPKNTPPIVVNYTPGVCQPSGTTLPQNAINCPSANGSGTSAYCCNGNYQCAAYVPTCL